MGHSCETRVSHFSRKKSEAHHHLLQSLQTGATYLVLVSIPSKVNKGNTRETEGGTELRTNRTSQG